MKMLRQVVATGRRVVVYMGDDEPGEYMYNGSAATSTAPGGDTSTLLSEGHCSLLNFTTI